MRETLMRARLWIVRLTALAWALGMSAAAPAETRVVGFDLEEIWLLPDLSHPSEPARQMTGSFEWTYQTGDFENGSGEFVELYIPWYAGEYDSLDVTFDLNSIEFTMRGNYHDLGLDLTIFLLEPLSPDQPAPVDTVRSMFDIQHGISHKGHVVNGSLVPLPGLGLTVGGTCPAAVQISVHGVSPIGQVALIYAFAAGSVTIPGGFPCAGTTLGLNQTATLASVITADANGDASLDTSVPARACGNIFIQALDLSSCGTSNVVALE